MNNYRDNMEIDIKSLSRYELSFWKLIIIFAMIGAISGGIIQYTMDSKVVENESPSKEELEPILTEAELQRVNTAVDSYKTYQKIHEVVKQNILVDIEKIDATGEIDKDTAEALKYKTEILGMATSGQFAGDQSVYSALNEEEKKVYDKLVERERDEEEQEEEQANKEELEENSNNKTFILPLAGFIFGLFIIIFILAVKYLLSPTLKTENDLRTAFKIPILGSVAKKNDEGLAVICSSIMALANTGRAKDILLCTSLSQGYTPDYISRIKDFLKEKEVSADSALNIISDPASIDKISRYDGLVFFESIGESAYENIAKEIELSENLGLNILGAVVVK